MNRWPSGLPQVWLPVFPPPFANQQKNNFNFEDSPTLFLSLVLFTVLFLLLSFVLCFAHVIVFTCSLYGELKEDLEVIPILKIPPYTYSKQAVLHTHTLFTGSLYGTMKEDLEVIPILKISPLDYPPKTMDTTLGVGTAINLLRPLWFSYVPQSQIK